MNLLVPAAAAAMLASAAMVGAAGGSQGYEWAQATAPVCAAQLLGPGPGRVGPISASVEIGDGGEITLIAQSEDWPIAHEPEPIAIELGFDDSAARIPASVTTPYAMGGLELTLDESLRRRLAGARSIEFYRDGRRIGAVPTGGLGPVLEAIRTCDWNPVASSPEAIEALEAAAAAVEAAGDAAPNAAAEDPDPPL
jgi:hypothetical protein